MPLEIAFPQGDEVYTTLIINSDDGEHWSENYSIGYEVRGRPSGAQFGSGVVMAFTLQGAGDIGTLVSPSPGNWSGLSATGQWGFSGSASVCEYLGLGRMTLTTTDTKEIYVYRSLDGFAWGDVVGIAQYSHATPAFAIHRGRLFLAYPELHSSQLCVTSSVDGINWSSALILTEGCTDSVALASLNDVLFLVLRSRPSNKLLLLRSPDGVTWSTGLDINETTQASPSMAAFGGKLHVAFIANDPSKRVLVTRSNDGFDWSGATETGQAASVRQYTPMDSLSIYIRP